MSNLRNSNMTIHKVASNFTRQNTLSNAVLMIHFSDSISSKPEQFSSYHQFKKSQTFKNLPYVDTAMNAFFINGGSDVYLLNYNLNDRKSFASYIRSMCDNLMQLELISTLGLVHLEDKDCSTALYYMNILCDYASRSNRLFIADINDEILQHKLDFIGESVMYYPWFKIDKKQSLAPSVIASAMMNKLATEGKISHSIANKEIGFCNNLMSKLNRSDMALFEKEAINPIIFQAKQGVRIWGVNAFNSYFSTVNELRVMKHVKREVKNISRNFIFEPNTVSLHDRLFFKINRFLYTLYEQGVLVGETQDEAYVLNAKFDDSGELNTLVFNLSIAIARPLEFIYIRLNRVEHDGMPATTSINSSVES